MKTRTVRVLENGTMRTETVTGLEDLQRLVGGYIQAVPVSNTFTVWVNEEGKLNGSSPSLAWPEGRDVLYGAVVFDGNCDKYGNTRQITAKALAAADAWALKNKLDAIKPQFHYTAEEWLAPLKK